MFFKSIASLSFSRVSVKNFQLSHSLTHSLPLLHFGFQHGYLQRMLGLDWAGLGRVGWIRTRTEGGLLAF